jgi:hypothetical protein
MFNSYVKLPQGIFVIIQLRKIAKLMLSFGYAIIYYIVFVYCCVLFCCNVAVVVWCMAWYGMASDCVVSCMSWYCIIQISFSIIACV